MRAMMGYSRNFFGLNYGSFNGIFVVSGQGRQADLEISIRR
jgi:hypothetical protein